MSIARRLLNELDQRLNDSVELTLYGRAAIALGFSNAPTEAAMSKDVDVVLWMNQAEELMKTNFWSAITEVNAMFESEGLFISHLFTEDQVILSPEWRQRRVKIEEPLRRLRLLRLGDMDLLLSKLMRNDPADFQDALFIYFASQASVEQVRHEILNARCPAIPELEEEFRIASTRLLNAIC